MKLIFEALNRLHHRENQRTYGYRVLAGLSLHVRDLLYGVGYLHRRIVDPGRGQPVLLCNSYPKSGTHLLFQILSAIPGYAPWHEIVSVQSPTGFMNTAFHIRVKYGSAPGGSVVKAHLSHFPVVLRIVESRRCVRYFVYRDPRDVAVSLTNWVMRPDNRFFLRPLFSQCFASDAERLMAAIVGLPLGTPFGSNASQPAIGEDFERWRPWLHDPNTLTVRFEDLVGARGGGNDESRWAAIERILDHAHSPMSRSEIVRRFSPQALPPEKAVTFHKGRIGSWRSCFTEAHKEAFKRTAGGLLVELGYEQGYDW